MMKIYQNVTEIVNQLLSACVVAWLHLRRVNPPTEEEIGKNVAAMKEVVRRAEELETEENKAMNRPSTKSTFKRAPASKYPIYKDYDAEDVDRKDDKTDSSQQRKQD